MPAIASLEELKAAQKEGLRIYAMFTCSKPWRRRALPVLRSRKYCIGGCALRDVGGIKLDWMIFVCIYNPQSAFGMLQNN